MRKKTSLLLPFLATIIAVNAQESSQITIGLKDCISQVLDGALIMAHPYQLRFDPNLKLQVTFDGIPVYGENNQFILTSFKNGELKVSNINAGDTVILVKKYLKFEEPVLAVDLNGNAPGTTIAADKLKYAAFHVGLPNSEISYSFPFEDINILYQNGNQLKKVKLAENSIPLNIADDIARSGSEILVLEIKVKFGLKTMNLPPAVYYLK